MTIQDCRPQYVKDGTYVPSSPKTYPASAPSVKEVRARSSVHLGGTFFRSRDAGDETNQIEVEYTLDINSHVVLNVYFQGALQETFNSGVSIEPPAIPPATCTPIVNPTIRSLVNGNSSLIEMPEIDWGGVTPAGGSQPIFTAINPPDDPLSPGDDCASLFSRTFLSGGGENFPPPNQIYTGPERTLVIVTLSELVNHDYTDDGKLYEKPQNEKILQYNGTQWVPYIPNSDCVLVP